MSSVQDYYISLLNQRKQMHKERVEKTKLLGSKFFLTQRELDVKRLDYQSSASSNSKNIVKLERQAKFVDKALIGIKMPSLAPSMLSDYKIASSTNKHGNDLPKSDPNLS